MSTLSPAQIAGDPFFAVPTMKTTTSAGDVELPILYYDNSCVFALFTADPDGVAAKLAGTGLIPALRIGQRPVVAMGLYEYRQTSIGSYNEVGIGILVYPERYKRSRSVAGWAQLLRRPDRRDQGTYVIDLPVTTQAACAAGSEIWGYPSELRLLHRAAIPARGELLRAAGRAGRRSGHRAQLRARALSPGRSGAGHHRPSGPAHRRCPGG